MTPMFFFQMWMQVVLSTFQPLPAASAPSKPADGRD